MSEKILEGFNLLPCPFCGNVPTVYGGKVYYHGMSVNQSYKIKCKCGVVMKISQWDFPSEKWNKRVTS